MTSDHFADVSKIIKRGLGATIVVHDFMFTRYACYLLAQNGDPKKEQMVFAQSYFDIHSTIEEFQFVKILSLNSLLPYVQYFKPIFSYYETQQIAEYLLEMNGRGLVRIECYFPFFIEKV